MKYMITMAETNFQRNIIFLLFILLMPIFSLIAQNQKAIKTQLLEDKIYYTPQLAGSSPTIKPATVNTSFRNYQELSSKASQVQQIKKTSYPVTWPQLAKQMSATKNLLSDVTIYSGIGNQRSPQIASLGNEMFVVFESDDTQGGTYPYGTLQIYHSLDGGGTWNHFDGLFLGSYRLSSPQILLVGTDVIVSYLSDGYLYTFRWVRSDGSLVKGFIPVPTVSTNEYVIDYKMVTDAQEYVGTSYLYMAYLFKRADGKNRVMFSYSQDTARTWNAYQELGLSQSELGAASVGLDYGTSGLYLCYLGTDTSAGSIIMRKSISFGSSWSPEISLPMDVYGGKNKKVGPMVSAIGQRVAVVYQYDYDSTATDRKTSGDFDVNAVVSDDEGVSWQERLVGGTASNEILPSVTSDVDGNFYVSFIRDGKTRVSMAGSEFAFGLPDSSSTANVSLDDFPSIYGSTISGTQTAYTTWTELSNSNGMDIFGAEVKLKIPPLSPSNLVATVVSNSEIKLNWKDNSLDETGFIIYYRQTGTGSGFAKITSVSTDVTSFTVTGLSPIGYDFYVRAYNANGLSLRTIIASATPGGGTANGLVAYYPFNGNANDESGNGNNGTIIGAASSIDRFGNANSAYSFDGLNNYIQIPNSSSLDINGPSQISICAWAKFSEIKKQGIVGKWGQIGGPQYLLYMDITNKVTFQVQPSGGVSGFASLTTPEINKWYFIVGVFDQSTRKLYFNGSLDNQVSNSYTIVSTTQNLEIGRYDETNYFNGVIDDIRIYNRALSAVEIGALYHEGGWNPNASPSAPQNLSATAGNAQVTLKWNKNTEADFLRYRIYSGTSPNPTTKVDSTTSGITDTNHTITQLLNGSTYYFRITAVNNAGAESGFSNEVSSKPNAIVDNTPPTFTVGPKVTGVPVIVNASGDVVSSPLPQVSASASDGESGISRMQVVYRNTSEQNWSKSPFDSSGTISFPIPTNKFVYNNKPVGVNYRVGAWDKAGNVTWSPYNSIDVKLGPLATDKSFDMPAASQVSNKTTAYRMISVPYDLSDKKPVSLLSNFGDHKENTVPYARWRFQRYDNGQYQDYEQFSTENAVTPGAAFFFIVKDLGTQIVVQGASIVRSDDMYNINISLKNGWNLIGNPFTIPYPVDSLEFINTSMIGRAYYSGSGSVGGWELTGANVAFIQPWQGIAIKVNVDGTMKFPSVGQRFGLPKLKNTPSRAPIEPAQAENPSNWMIPINAYRSDIDMRCEGGSVGMAQGASEGDDQYDVYIPPFVGDKNIAVYFNGPEGAMLRDIRPLNDEGGVWEMHVVTGDAGARVKLQLGDKLNLPNSAFEAYLIDVDQKIAHNLKEIQSLEINSGNGIRNFRVVVGKKSFVEGNNTGIALTPSSMKLYANYPNPFNPETVIRYTVPDASASYTVMLKIFNVLGQEIATLVNEQKSSGYYEVKWNALQQSSGIYFYELSITDGSKTFQDIKKMVLMK